jgi:UDP-N-acetylmuramoyl-L-alanine---L-glutamate ligase
VIAILGVGRETRELLGVLDRDEPGAEVLVLDERPLSPGELPPTPRLEVDVRGGVDLDREDALPREVDEVYRSPGISPYRPALRRAIERGVPTTTPTGRWARGRDGSDVIALTGTKGKSTTAALTAHLLRAAGRRAELVGNIGRSALSAGPAADADDVVLELSSYQLADMNARFGLAGITTLLRDHVPWHGTVERYHRDKLRLLELSDRSVVDPQVAAHPAATAATARSGVVTTAAHDGLRAALFEAGLVGEHLVRDAALALALVDARLGRPAGVSDLVASLHDFTPLPHRLAPVRVVDGVTFVDDSISTVPESAVAAVRTYLALGPVTVLLGGDDRGQDLAPLVQLLRDDGVRAVLLPPLGERLHTELAPVAGDRVRRADDLAAAVTLAAEVTPRGGAVVLSPAAPSFTSYRDFVARGEHFVALVRALVRGSPV